MKKPEPEQTFIYIQNLRIIFEYTEYGRLVSVTAAPQTFNELLELQKQVKHPNHTPLPEVLFILNMDKRTQKISLNVNTYCLSKYSDDIGDGFTFIKALLMHAQEMLADKRHVSVKSSSAFDDQIIKALQKPEDNTDNDFEAMLKASNTKDERRMRLVA